MAHQFVLLGLRDIPQKTHSMLRFCSACSMLNDPLLYLLLLGLKTQAEPMTLTLSLISQAALSASAP